MFYTSKEVYEFISKSNRDPIVERKICTVSGAEFAIFQSDIDFYNKISPTFAGQKFQIPTPTLCPEERQRRRLIIRNERKIYRRKCDATGDNIISTFSPDKPHKVYHSNYRRSDKRDPLHYGKDFDFNRSFTENFEGLFLTTPLLALYQLENENCEYTHSSAYSKNCYMCFVSVHNEDCLYLNIVNNSNNIVDSTMIFESEYCYDCLDCDHCYNCYHCYNMESCNNCYNCTNCINSSHCIECHNLNGESYMIQNKKVSKDEFINYEKKKKTTIPSEYVANKISGCENVTGNFLYNCKDTHSSFDLKNSYNSKYCTYGNGATDCQDLYAIYPEAELCYNCIPIGFGTYNVTNSFFVYSSKNTHYSVMCRDCESCFGCVSLRNKSYCIFNKQYTKESYELLVARIIQHMKETDERGEFFHPSLSPFGYNETVAQEYFPLTQGEASVFPLSRGGGGLGTQGLKRQTNSYDPIIPEGAKVIYWKNNPEEPKDDDSILKSIFVCEISGRPYRIIKQELDFYRKHNLPLPRKHPDIRHEERMKLRPGRTLYLRHCDKCKKEMISVYTSNNQGKVFCEECYTKKIYS